MIRPSTRPCTGPRRVVRHALGVCAAAWCLAGLGCQSMESIDRRIDRVVEQRAAAISVAKSPTVTRGEASPPTEPEVYVEAPPTENPGADELSYRPAPGSPEAVLDQLQSYYTPPANPALLGLADSLRQAQRTAREYLNAEEDFLLAAIRLLVERHDWGPRFFDTLSTAVSAQDDREYTAALSVINELRVAQRLPYGGEVEARLVTDAAYDLISDVSDRYTNTNTLILSADIPLLRDAGLIAREDLIQAERDLVYAARDFERFRRELVFSIAADYFRLVSALQGIYNQRRQLRGIQQLYLQRSELVRAGRVPPFELKNVEQRLLSARVGLLNQQEAYKLALDRFKIRLGIDVTAPARLVPQRFFLDDPDASVETASRAALDYRLDYQNDVDRLDDARRGVRNARNQLLPDLDVGVGVALNDDAEQRTDTVSFDFDDATYDAAVTLGLPLDREVERLNLRAAIIALQRAARTLGLTRDNLVLDARSALRDIKQARYALQLQQEAVAINTLRIEELRIKRSEVDVQSQLDAVDDLLASENDLAAAESDLRIAILNYLLTTGQLRVEADGAVQPLPGMSVSIEPVLIEESPGVFYDLGDAAFSVPEDFVDALSEDPDVNPGAPGDAPADPAQAGQPADDAEAPGGPDPGADPPPPGDGPDGD